MVTAASQRGLANSSQLLAEADRARRAGQRDRALALLHQIMGSQPGTPEAAVAAFSLARMQMQQDPDAAAAALRAGLASGTPESLREDAMVRLVEAYARAGKRDLAASAAEDYRRQFENGRRLAEVERWTGRP